MNVEKYRKIFFDEASVELNSLENLLLDIDKVSSDIESINSIFRLFHRLKSSSAMMGLNNFSDLSHHAEDLLSGVKEGKIDIGESVTGALLSVVDTMRHLIREAESGNITGYRSDDLLARLKEICGAQRNMKISPPLNPLPQGEGRYERLPMIPPPLTGGGEGEGERRVFSGEGRLERRGL